MCQSSSEFNLILSFCVKAIHWMAGPEPLPAVHTIAAQMDSLSAVAAT